MKKDQATEKMKGLKVWIILPGKELQSAEVLAGSKRNLTWAVEEVTDITYGFVTIYRNENCDGSVCSLLGFAFTCPF